MPRWPSPACLTFSSEVSFQGSPAVGVPAAGAIPSGRRRVQPLACSSAIGRWVKPPTAETLCTILDVPHWARRHCWSLHWANCSTSIVGWQGIFIERATATKGAVQRQACPGEPKAPGGRQPIEGCVLRRPLGGSNRAAPASTGGGACQRRYGTVMVLVEHLDRAGSPPSGLMVWSRTSRYSPAVSPGS